MENQIRVRYAPSPTGHLHIGGARTALFNYLLARKHNGKFIIRIEDTDQTRNVEDAAQKQLNYLKWLGIDWDESVDVEGEYGPYRSMERLDLYNKYLSDLLNEKHAYHCYCNPQELEKERQEQFEKGETPKYSGKCWYLTPEQKDEFEKNGRKPSVRFRVPEDEIIRVNDLVRGEVNFESNGIGDFVIVRPDGIPTYNFAVTVDDYLMKITHVIRGEEHLSNTPRQVLIYKALGAEQPSFAHISLILNQDRQKMSKRDESIIQFIEQYQELGFLPDAILNFIALLGWSPEGEQEILSKKDLITMFSLDRVSKSPAVFDVQKLNYINNHYIKEAPLEKVVEICLPHLQRAGYIPEDLSDEQNKWVIGLVNLMKDRLNYGQEIVGYSKLFFDDEITYGDEEKAILSEGHIPVVMEAFVKGLEELEDYNPETIKTVLKNIQKETGYKGKQLFMPIRIVATGEQHGPDLQETLYLLSKDKVLQRVNRLLTKGTKE